MSSGLKTLLGITCLITGLSAAQAQQAPSFDAPLPPAPAETVSTEPSENDPSRAFERGYLGLYGGEVWMGMKGKDKDFLADRTANLKGKGPIGGVILGFNRGFAEDWLYGIEANAGFNTARIKKDGIPATVILQNNMGTTTGKLYVKGRLSWVFGVAGRLGYKIAPSTAVFARLGVALNYAELIAIVTPNHPFFGTPTEPLGGKPRKAFVPSLIPGIDIEYSINDNWNLRLSTSYSFHLPALDVTDKKLKHPKGYTNKTLVTLSEAYVGAALVYKLK